LPISHRSPAQLGTRFAAFWRPRSHLHRHNWRPQKDTCHQSEAENPHCNPLSRACSATFLFSAGAVYPTPTSLASGEVATGRVVVVSPKSDAPTNPIMAATSPSSQLIACARRLLMVYAFTRVVSAANSGYPAAQLAATASLLISISHERQAVQCSPVRRQECCVAQCSGHRWQSVAQFQLNVSEWQADPLSSVLSHSPIHPQWRLAAIPRRL
jgi:hypothetical protein